MIGGNENVGRPRAGRVGLRLDYADTNTDGQTDKVLKTHKMVLALRNDPTATFVRVFQTDVWSGTPVNAEKPITFDWMSVIVAATSSARDGGLRGAAVFVGDGARYAAHRAAMEAHGFHTVVLRPSDVAGVPDLRAVAFRPAADPRQSTLDEFLGISDVWEEEAE